MEMAESSVGIEESLVVGGGVVFQPEPGRQDGPRHKSNVRGWRKNTYIIIDRPLVKNRLLPVAPGQPCVVRLIEKGMACAFACAVLECNSSSQYPEIRLTWPEIVKAVAVRKHERVEVRIPCTMLLENGTDAGGEISDISSGGLGIVAQSIGVGETIQLSFKLPNAQEIEALKVLVRSNVKIPRGTFMGCEFADGGDPLSQEVALFVSRTLEWMR